MASPLDAHAIAVLVLTLAANPGVRRFTVVEFYPIVMLAGIGERLRIEDFVRGGLPLLLIMWVSLSLLVPRYFPLY